MKAEIYTWSTCPFCVRPTAVLRENAIEFDEHVMDRRDAELAELKSRYNHFTVPIILIDGEFIGGCDELVALVRSGKLT